MDPLSIVKEKGPVLPVQIAREVNDNILMTSARLSELLAVKQIKISNLKVGGSPLYYAAGQESKLQNFIDNLNGMEKKAYNFLLQNKVLRDSAQEPAIRVALREIKDFAIPLQVNYENKAEIFWKWYLTDTKEAESFIKNIISEKEVSATKTLEKPKEEIKKEPLELKKDTTTTKKKIDKTLFLNKTNDFLNKIKIKILETREIKKNSEIDLIIELQTQLGSVKYFCKAKNKKKINDGDLSSALLNAQSKGLPLLFLTTGKASKKLKEKLNTDFKNIVYREM